MSETYLAKDIGNKDQNGGMEYKMNELLVGVVGSTAYGLATPESDIDKLGVFLGETKDYLGFGKPTETVVQKAPLPDKTMHELKKFLSLCLANNPTVTELLFLESYEVRSEIGDFLVENRQKFLSQRIRNTYGGYADQQRKRLVERGDFGSDLKKRQNKHGRHCCRLILQGSHALKHGEIKVKLDAAEVSLCRAMGDYAEKDKERFSGLMEEMFQQFDNLKSDLPKEPDQEFFEGYLVGVRLRSI